MTTQALAYVRNIVDSITMQTILPFVEHTRHCDAVLSWLDDASSKSAYRQEISFLALRTLYGEEFAVRNASTVSQEAVLQACAQVQALQQQGTLPILDCGQERYQAFSVSMLATTFIMGQYAYGEQIQVKPGDVFLDCGACFGDTALWAHRAGAAKVYSFEPAPLNFQLLQQNLCKYVPEGEAIQVALGNQKGSLPFAEGPDTAGASALHPQGNIQVDIDTLDNVCAARQIKPDFIKMDIEGAEVSALLGAQKTIAAYKPRLAICLYHKITDMWEVPWTIKNIDAGYQFYCRKNHPVHEFILYAVHPQQKAKQMSV